MKVLVVASEIYDKSFPKQSITGLAIMVRDIYDEVSKECDVFLYSTHVPLKQSDITETLHLIDSTTKRWFIYMSIKDIIKSILYIGKGIKGPLRYIKKSAKEKICISRFLEALARINPDIVNFHDPDYLNMRCIDACERLGVKYVFTDHLYIGDAEGCNSYSQTIDNEKRLFSKPNINVSAISTGMRNRILNDFPNLNSERVYLTLDGTHFCSNNIKTANPESRKIILCIANVMQRKNQIQLVRALSRLEKNVRNEFVVYFLGSDNKGDLVRAIEVYNCSDVAEYKGKVSSEEISSYYKKAFATITTTLCEGFGLTIIEGYTYGLPSIIPNDIDSFSDLYDENATIVISDRSDKAILEALLKCISHKWDDKKIIDKSKDFCITKVSSSYISMYRNISVL